MKYEQPIFSIVVPTYNRQDRLTLCLQALARLDYPRDRYEVIVVDDGSMVSLEDVVMRSRDHLDIALLKQPHAGPAAARNVGARHAKGEFLAFTDDDCMPSPDWLQKLALRFAEASDCAIGGRTLNALSDNPYAEASQLLIDYLCAYYNADLDRASFVTSNNLALLANHFHTIGGFDETFQRAAAEDRELCDRWRYHGYRIIYAPEVVMYHTHRLTLWTFWKQHFSYGRGAFCFHQVRAQRGQHAIRLEPLTFYLGMLCFPFSQMPHWPGVLLMVLMGLTQIANMTGFFWESVSRCLK